MNNFPCPVCRREDCGHLLRRRSNETFNSLKAKAETPLDLGVARFAAEVIDLMKGGER